MSRRRFLVAWDISDPRRLKAVRRCSENFGHPLQKSVFLCELDREEKAKYLHRLRRIHKAAHDQIVFIDLGPDTRDTDDFIESLGLPANLPGRPIVV